MEPLDIAAVGVRTLLQQLPSSTHTGIIERTRSEIEQLDDYVIDWQITASPINPLACPIDLIASCEAESGCAWGFSFDTRGRIAPHLGLKLGARTSHLVAFGTEPIIVSPERVVAIIGAVIRGQAALHYRSLAGHLMKTAGVVLVPGESHRFWGYGLPLGTRKVFHYAPWSQAA